jgi:hypothetical protein
MSLGDVTYCYALKASICVCWLCNKAAFFCAQLMGPAVPAVPKTVQCFIGDRPWLALLRLCRLFKSKRATICY